MVAPPLAPPIVVSHRLGRYPVYVTAGALSALAELVRLHLPGRRVSLITDSTVGRLYEEWESGASGSWRPAGRAAVEAHAYDWVTRLSVEPGEQSKTRDRWIELTDALFDRRLGRDSGVVALGGGVVGDLAGFVAATFARGVPYIQVPTTLLAMLDSSVGGKTGVDTPHGKNLVGAFHPPAVVIADPMVLRTLPDREYRAGLAEAVKHGLIADAAYFETMERDTTGLLARTPAALEELVRRSVAIKAEVVSADEREGGRRAVLNAGHTVAHAIELVSEFRVIHGEAVGLGLLAETAMAERLGIADPGLHTRVRALLGRLGLPIRLPLPLPAERLVDAMAADKKNRGSQIRCAFPARLGTMAGGGTEWTHPADLQTLLAGLDTIG